MAATTAAVQEAVVAASNAQNIKYLVSALGISISVILTLAGVIWHSFKKTQEDQSDRLDAGDEEFNKTKLELLNLKRDVASIRDWLVVAETKIKHLEEESLKHHDTLESIKIHHKHQHNEDIK